MPTSADAQFAAVYSMDESFFGSSVELRRGALVTPNVTAVVEEIDNEITDDMTLHQVVVRSRDYLIRAADYIFAGQVMTPEKGDRFVETIGGNQVTFEAMPIGHLPAVERENEDGVRWRIRTKEVD